MVIPEVRKKCFEYPQCKQPPPRNGRLRLPLMCPPNVNPGEHLRRPIPAKPHQNNAADGLMNPCPACEASRNIPKRFYSSVENPTLFHPHKYLRRVLGCTIALRLGRHQHKAHLSSKHQHRSRLPGMPKRVSPLLLLASGLRTRLRERCRLIFPLLQNSSVRRCKASG